MFNKLALTLHCLSLLPSNGIRSESIKCIGVYNSLVIMPTHQSGSYSINVVPALTPEAPAFFNPFFLIIKLAPMNKLEDKARTNPLILSDDMPLYTSFQLCVSIPSTNHKKKNPKPYSSLFHIYTSFNIHLKKNASSQVKAASTEIPGSRKYKQ
ncbi:hypothetical protein H5410_051420, partial [Solanum commersonii]